MRISCSSWLAAVIVLGAVLLGNSSAARAANDPQRVVPYCKGENLQQTLLTTRAAYQAWVAEQPAVRRRVKLDPWKGLGGLVDGKPSKVDFADKSHLEFSRKITAQEAGSLTVGIGGGDHVDLWLNRKQVASVDTRLVSGRYGCAYRFDGTRVDQVLVDLPLTRGENELMVRLAPGEDGLFYFSISPKPIPRIWEQVRRDFLPVQNPILELVPAGWFEPNGWLTAQDTKLEEQLIEQLAAECGDQSTPLRADLRQLCQSKVERNDGRWLDLCVKASVLGVLHRDLGRLRAAVDELGQSHPNDYPTAELRAQLDDYQSRLTAQAGVKLDPSDPVTQRLMAEMPAMRQRMLVEQNPLLRGAELMFVKRYTYNSKHYYDDFQHIFHWGGNLCVLSLADGRVRQLVPQRTEGVFDRYDISFDARRVAFGYRRPKAEGFRLYEIGVDGSGLRQLTCAPADEERRVATYGKTSTGDKFYGSSGYRFWTDDVHPCYLPDGGLCFSSTRCEHGVLCTALHYLACTNLFRIDADGGNLRPLSYGALSEFTPTMMEDGRILYNRWEYVYKGIAAVQPLWTMRPDGSGNEEFYGDNIANPGVFWQARQVPGRPRMAVCIGCGHEPLGVGQVLLVNLNKNKRTPEAMVSLTPEVKTRGLRGLYQLRNGVWQEDSYGAFYADPYPLSDKFFLVSCNPDRRYNDETAYGIYLLDAFGNRVPVYRDPEMSCWQPMLLRPRSKPPVLSSPHDDPTPKQPGMATLFVSDVYRGLDGVKRGTVKYLRVMEQVAKPWSAEVDLARNEDRRLDAFRGHLVVSGGTHIWVAVLHGIVPVREDGSACLEVPARRNLFFQALDADFMEVQRMRTFVNLEPNERRSCIGCHEHRTQAPESRSTLAMGRSPAKLSAQPGEVAPRPLYYPADVQPLLDRHCVRCHNGQDSKASPDLRGELTTLFSRSYESLTLGDQLDVIREWVGGHPMGYAEAVPPYSHGSHCSKLVSLLKKGHYDAKLSNEEWIKLVTWIDCGAPYYGSYFGRRNLKYQGEPDFRPVPTVDSACGIPPEPPRIVPPEPLPAQLLAWWPLDGEDVASASDESGQGHNARSVGVTSCAGHDGRGARQFDGRAYLESHGLGMHTALSISLWVKPLSLNRQWNPLVFGNDTAPGVVHFSLLADGTPNVAINTGKSWTHRKANVAIDAGRWHHVVLVCDGRTRGEVRFYVDGKPAGSGNISLGQVLNCDVLRIGAWNRWENRPAANFDGQIDDVRLFSGMLTESQASDLAAGKL
jgi:hypothetical protein